MLIGINLAFFLVTAVQARSAMDLSSPTLYLRGGLIPAEVASGEYWRLLTAGFLHGNLIHIATNMMSLYCWASRWNASWAAGGLLTDLPAQPARRHR